MNDLHGNSLKLEEWSPCGDLTIQQKNENYAIIILNTPINFCFNPNFILHLWNKAKVRITVDGGTKRWVQWLTLNNYKFENVIHPDLITGDMDSLPKDILKIFSSCNTKIIVTPDQNETDFVKALRELDMHCSNENTKIDTIYVLADTSGRFDQIMANINALFKARSILPNTRIFLLASGSLTWLLNTGHHIIHIPNNLRNKQEWCALIPIGEPCIITSTGLKWNLDNRKLQFGSVVSTSNTYDGSPLVTIKTDKPVIWSMSIEMLL